MYQSPIRSGIKIRAMRFLYLGIAVVLALITVHAYQPTTQAQWMVVVGRILGFWGITGIIVQFVLSGRLKWLEKGIGHDQLLRWHKTNGNLTFVALLLHPLFILYLPLLRVGVTVPQIVQTYTTGVWLGVAALALLILTIVTTVFSHILKINYEHWKKLHLLVYAVMLLGFAHSFLAGTSIMTRGPLWYWWLLLGGIAAYVVVYRYGWRVYQNRNNMYEVVDVFDETQDVKTIRLKSLSSQKLAYAPGQFAFTRFYSEGLSTEEHHFTLSSSPLEEHIAFSIKALGDYTSQLHKIQPGDRALIEGSYGVCSNVGMTGPFVFIAGGIGITPVRSMLKTMHLSNTQDKALLIYANRTPDDVVFGKELDEMAQGDWLRVAHVYSDAEVEGAYKGFVTEEILRKELSISDFEFRISNFFIIGPPPMMDAMKKTLRTLGVSSDKILTEKFALR